MEQLQLAPPETGTKPHPRCIPHPGKANRCRWLDQEAQLLVQQLLRRMLWLLISQTASVVLAWMLGAGRGKEEDMGKNCRGRWQLSEELSQGFKSCVVHTW